MNVETQGIFQYEDELKEKNKLIDEKQKMKKAWLESFLYSRIFSRRILQFDNEILNIFI